MKFFTTLHSGTLAFIIVFLLFTSSVEAKSVSVLLKSQGQFALQALGDTSGFTNAIPFDVFDIPSNIYVQSGRGGSGEVGGVHGAWLTINYNAKIFDSAGAEIADGATVSVGSTIKLRFLPHVRDDVYWFASVSRISSPYGRWDSTTPVKDYNDLDLIMPEGMFGTTGKLYASAPVIPPQKTLNTLSNLSCGNYVTDSYGYGKDCTVTTAGAIQPVFTFGQTTGQLSAYKNGGSWTIPASPSLFTVPAQNVTYSLTAVGGNNPPAAPVITGPTSGVVYFSRPTNIASVIFALVNATSTTYSYQASSVDPDGDTVRTGWDFGSGQPELWTNYVVSGAQSSNVDRNWTIATTTTFRVRAQDSKGAYSGWTSYTVVITTNCTAPAAPASISPSGTGTAGLQNITWSAVSGASSYTINVNDTTSDASFTPGSNNDVTTNVTTNTYAYNFQSGHSYSLWVNSNASCGAPSTNNTSAQVVIPGGSVSADLKLNGQDNVTVAPGDAVTLSWTSSNATNCSSNGTTPFVTGGATSGSTSFTASASASYGLRCVNATTDANDVANLTVSGARSAQELACTDPANGVCVSYCTANPTSALCQSTYGIVAVSLQSKASLNAQYKDVSALAISEKTSVYLQWVPNNAKKVFCSLRGGGTEIANDTTFPSRMYGTPALSQSQVYTVTCSNPISTASDSVRIGVLKVSEF